MSDGTWRTPDILVTFLLDSGFHLRLRPLAIFGGERV
jgi:hypothetical protein